jgi:hypothetical protein
MKISKRGEYALRALIDLGIASELGWPMLQISELASKEKLPIKFLEQIFTQLKSAGYVASRRGKFDTPSPCLGASQMVLITTRWPLDRSNFFAMDVITFLSCTLTDGIQREWRAIQTGKRAPAVASVRGEAFPAQFRRAPASDRPGRREFRRSATQ